MAKKLTTVVLSLRIPVPVMRVLAIQAAAAERSTADYVRRLLTKVAEQGVFKVTE